jgi:uncharacterized protein YkwD
VTRACHFACGKAVALTVALCVAGLGVPHAARAQAPGPSCIPLAPCAAALVTAQGSSGFARRLFRLQNAARRRHGLRRLTHDGDLALAARRHARDMVHRHYFGHVSPAHRDVVDRVASTGYPRGRFAAQENLYWWRPRQSPAAVLQAWMASAAHRANILNPRLRNFGLAVVMRSPFGGGGITVVGVFGRR